MNRADKCGRTPVYAAAADGHTVAIEALVKLGADMNRADEDGWTPLRKATDRGHAAAADALRRLGAAS